MYVPGTDQQIIKIKKCGEWVCVENKIVCDRTKMIKRNRNEEANGIYLV